MVLYVDRSHAKWKRSSTSQHSTASKISLSLFHVNILSRNKYLDDLHNLLSIKFQIQVIGIRLHDIKKGSCLNGSLPGYTFELEPAAYTHGGVGFFINDNVCYKLRNDLKMLLNGCLESIFINFSFNKNF